MTRYFLALLMCSTLLYAPHAAQAAIDAAGAEAVKKMMKESYEYTNDYLKSQSPNFEMMMTGDFKVEPKGTYYEVTSPHIILNIKEKFFPVVIDYGVDHINVMPGATPTQWRMAGAMPSPIRVITQNTIPCAPDAKKCTPTTKKSELEIHQKTTRMQMLWDHAQKTFLKSDILLENFEFKWDGKAVPVTLASVTSKTTNTEKTPGIFDSQNALSVKGLVVNVTPENCPTCKTSGKIGVGEIAMNSLNSGFDIKKYHDFNNKMRDMTNAGFDPDKGISGPAFSALWSEVMKNGFDTMDSGKGDVAIRDITANIINKDGKPENFAFKELKYYGGFDAWRSEKANVFFGLDVGGMTWPTSAQNDPMFKILTPYIPMQAHHKIEVKNLPHRKLFEQIGAMAQNAIGTIEKSKCSAGTPADKCPKMDGQAMQQAQMLGLQAMMTLPQLFADAGTKVTLHVDSDAPKLTTLIDGDFTANAAAMFSGVGKLKAVLGGIDALITDLQTVSKDPTTSPADAKQFQGALAGLTGLQMFGQQGTDSKGNPARIFDVTVDEKGAIKLNGADMGAFGTSTGTQAGPGQTPPPSSSSTTGKP